MLWGGQLRTLYIDPPFCLIQAKRFQCSFLTQPLSFVDVLIPSVVSGTGISFRVLV